MNIVAMDFRQLVVIYVSMGPHRQRDLATFAQVSPDTVARWFYGTARPHPHTEQHLKNYLLNKFMNPVLLQAEEDSHKEGLTAARAHVARAEKTWDAYIDSLAEGEPQETAREQKAKAIEALRRELALPKEA